jgi:alcohol oxidase
MHITGPKHDSPLDFDVGFFSDKDDIDLKKQLWGYKMQREILRRTTFYRGELAAGHPNFPAGSAVAVVEGLTEPLSDV